VRAAIQAGVLSTCERTIVFVTCLICVIQVVSHFSRKSLGPRLCRNFVNSLLNPLIFNLIYLFMSRHEVILPLLSKHDLSIV